MVSFLRQLLILYLHFVSLATDFFQTVGTILECIQRLDGTSKLYLCVLLFTFQAAFTVTYQNVLNQNTKSDYNNKGENPNHKTFSDCSSQSLSLQPGLNDDTVHFLIYILGPPHEVRTSVSIL